MLQKPLLILGLGLLALALLSWVAVELPQNVFDVWVGHWITSCQNSFLTALATLLAQCGGLVGSGFIIAIVVVYLGGQRHYQPASRVGSRFMLAIMVAWLLKIMVMRPRPLPLDATVQTFGSSFPSAHSTYAMCLALLLGYCCKSQALRYVLVAWVLLMGWSRIYLGAHYLTDVIGGYLVAWLVVVGIPWRLNAMNKMSNETQSNKQQPNETTVK